MIRRFVVLAMILALAVSLMAVATGCSSQQNQRPNRGSTVETGTGGYDSEESTENDSIETPDGGMEATGTP